jgi:hypothetical protein
LKQYNKALWFLRRANAVYPDRPSVLIAAVDNRLRADKPQEADYWVKRAFDTIGIDRVALYLVRQAHDEMGLPLDFQEIASYLSKKIGERYKENYANVVEQLAHIVSVKEMVQNKRTISGK